MGPALPAVAIGLYAAGTAASINESRKAARAAARAERAKARLTAAELRRSKTQQLEQAQAARADILAGGEAATGGATVSGVAGGTGAVTSRTAANISFLNSAEATSNFISQQGIFASAAQDRALLYKTVADTSLSIFTNPSITSLGTTPPAPTPATPTNSGFKGPP